ncbi:MAG: NADH-quinone oxidoreductase subunit L [Burkholderiales bacterium]|nr:NADH-quinone oxidoreductase subunit L [Burkholderiales bacterium]
MSTKTLLLLIALAPLAGAVVAGMLGTRFLGGIVGRRGAHSAAILGVLVSFAASVVVAQQAFAVPGALFNEALYTWTVADGVKFDVGFLVDRLTVTMMLVVTFVSLMVHVYTIGYMAEDPGYQRFFGYISLFTFSMLMLVMSNNFLQLFFGWEAVGLVSYLLIGFWYTRPTAIYANLKAFLVNRVGDFGFLLGIGLVLAHFGSMNYAEVFAHPQLAKLAATPIDLLPGSPTVVTAVCIGLFVGAMGKSAQFPLHVWLPDSMEGPTPISALIHAATMVTAGIFMVARMSPLFELSEAALSFVIVTGAITALFMGFLGIVQNDIKRVVAYSTLSQLGYMTVALGCSAYSVAIFHLMTHAFFKALLFLAAGSVIIGMHHNQDMRYMGGAWKHMKITWITSLIGSLALIGTPLFSGFYSKDSIIEAAHFARIPGASFAYWCVLAGVFVTAFYSFRMYFLVFHGRERYEEMPHDDAHADEHHGLAHGEKPHESPWVVWLPLVLLAIPSVGIGYLTIEPMLFGSVFSGVIAVSDAHPAMAGLAQMFRAHGGAAGMATHALATAPFWLAAAGVALAWVFYIARPAYPAAIKARFGAVHALLDNKYYLDRFNEIVFAGGARALGRGLWRGGDVSIIDGLIVNGSARLVGFVARVSRLLQTGHLYQYAFVMIVAVWFAITKFAFLGAGPGK